MAELVGKRQLIESLKRLPKQYKRDLPKIHKTAATPVAKTAAKLAPHRTGALSASLRALGSQKSGRAVAGKASVPYAGVINYGWGARNIEPSLFLERALKQEEEKVIKIFIKEQDRLIDKVWGASSI